MWKHTQEQKDPEKDRRMNLREGKRQQDAYGQ
jgi:hypothetical protein